MSCDDRNIYQTAREGAGMTQEASAECLCISVESLRAYEGRRRLPPEHVVIAMADTYSRPLLAYQHLKQTMATAADVLPDIREIGLAGAVLRIQKEVNDVLRCRDRLIEITCDGIIDSTEREEFDKILKELADLQGAILTLKYAKESDGDGDRKDDLTGNRTTARRVPTAQACCSGTWL